MLSSVDTINFIYAGLLTTGGLIGFLKAGSIPSLVAGAGSGAVVALVTYNNSQYKTIVVTAISAILTVVMGKRYIRSGKIVPAGIIATSSLTALVAQFVKIKFEGLY